MSGAPPDQRSDLAVFRRHQARRATMHNAFLWGIGNGLFSTSLITYLIRDLCSGQPGAQVGATIAWVVAAPRIAGVLRLAVPTILDRFGNRKFFCILCYTLAPLILSGIPFFLPGMIRLGKQYGNESFAGGSILAMLVVFWCLYHLVEYFGTVSLWSWYGDLVPERTRGRFLGVREAWMIAGQTLGFLTVGLYSYHVIESMPKNSPRWEAYLLPAYLGLGFLFASVFPLLKIPELPWKRQEKGLKQRLRVLFSPMTDSRFALFVFFGCWLQMSIGLTQSSQHLFGMFVLNISMLTSLGMATLTRVGQWGIGPRAGKWIDRLGNRFIMSISLGIVATGSLFYAAAEKPTWWLLWGAATVWIFWVGVNIGISKTVLDLAPQGKNAGYLALYFTLTTLSLALATLLGGYLIPPGQERIGFIVSFVLRLAAIPIFWWALSRKTSASLGKTG